VPNFVSDISSGWKYQLPYFSFRFRLLRSFAFICVFVFILVFVKKRCQLICFKTDFAASKWLSCYLLPDFDELGWSWHKPRFIACHFSEWLLVLCLIKSRENAHRILWWTASAASRRAGDRSDSRGDCMRYASCKLYLAQRRVLRQRSGCIRVYSRGRDSWRSTPNCQIPDCLGSDRGRVAGDDACFSAPSCDWWVTTARGCAVAEITAVRYMYGAGVSNVFWSRQQAPSVDTTRRIAFGQRQPMNMTSRSTECPRTATVTNHQWVSTWIWRNRAMIECVDVLCFTSTVRIVAFVD